MMTLGPYLHAWSRKAYQLGEADCASFVIQWLINLGFDPSPYVGEYSTKYSGIRRYAKDGLHKAFGAGLVAMGWEAGGLRHGSPALTLPDSVGIYSERSPIGPAVYEFGPFGLLLRTPGVIERGFEWRR